MKTSPTDAFRPDPTGGAGTLLVFTDEQGALGHWLLVDGAGGALHGDGAETLPHPGAGIRSVLAVPGTAVAIHWLALEGEPTAAQAAAAARLLLADASVEPLPEMHVAAGRAEQGLTPVAVVPRSLVASWLAAAGAAGLDPEAIVPMPILLPLPPGGFIRRGIDYRGPAAAFALEPELAVLLTGEAPVEEIDEAEFEAGLAAILAELPLNLRQGAFARRRRLKLEGARVRRLAWLALALALLTLAVQVAAILSYTFAADRMESEAAALSASAAGAGDARPGFAAVAATLFDAIRATPNVEVARLDYRPDGSLIATLMIDGPATLDAVRQRLEAAGLQAETSEMRNAGGRPAADVTVQP